MSDKAIAEEFNLGKENVAKSIENLQSHLKISFFKKRHEYSLYLFSKENLFRKFCSYITLHKWYETAILFFVALNCITLAMERPSILESSLVSI